MVQRSTTLDRICQEIKAFGPVCHLQIMKRLHESSQLQSQNNLMPTTGQCKKNKPCSRVLQSVCSIEGSNLELIHFRLLLFGFSLCCVKLYAGYKFNNYLDEWFPRPWCPSANLKPHELLLLKTHWSAHMKLENTQTVRRYITWGYTKCDSTVTRRHAIHTHTRPLTTSASQHSVLTLPSGCQVPHGWQKSTGKVPK